ncbi:hypothetical protein [Paraglaciecola sp. 2405UD69-4]|uniref:hypothetical protein n=1 Tax=Paraglaciecola sp. 2405UD69-4 TaxID=3391836 RepID=UPI0039C9B856
MFKAKLQSVKWVIYTSIVLFLFSCGTKDSTNVAVEDIYARVAIDVNNSGTAKIRIDLKEGNFIGESLDLTGNDTLQLSFNGESIAIKKDNDLFDIDYEASVETHGLSGVFSFGFVRNNQTVVAAEANLSPSFDILTPTKGSVFNSSDSLVDISWSNPNQAEVVELHGTLTCDTIEDDLDLDTDSENEEYRLQDTGSDSLPLYHLISNLILEVTLEDEEIISSNPCDLSFDLAKVHEKPLTGFMSGSTIRVSQNRSSYTYKVTGIESNN